MAAVRNALWRPIAGSGRSLAVSSGANSTDTVAMGLQSYACQLSAITGNVLVTISHAGNTAATATTDMLVKSTDPPIQVACAPGDKVSAWGLGAATLYIVELTH